ncbi:MAG: hypothetical protein U0T73_14040 [Chitinophagales bacterium]
MKKWWLPLLLLLPVTAFSQAELVSRVSALIADGNYLQAKLCVDSALQQDPKNVNALMMKGNVLLNYVLSKTEPLYVITADDESIFSPQLAGLREPQLLVRSNAAQQVESIWRQCLELDATRTDIRSGLCTVYAMADWPDSIVKELPEVVRGSKEKGDEFAYTLATYAQLLNARGDQKGCFQVYEKLCALYPNFKGISGEEAAQFYRNGNLKAALIQLEKATPFPKNDERLLVNAIDIFIAANLPLRVIEVFRAAEQPNGHEADFYQALYNFSTGGKTWKKEMQAFLKFPPTDSLTYRIAKKLADPNFKNSYSDYEDLMKLEPNDFEMQLLSFQAKNQFPDSVQPQLLYAGTFLNGKNYATAIPLLEALYNKPLPAALRQQVQWQYAWALYAAGDYPRALTPWSGLKLATDPAIKSSAMYFTARCYQMIGMPDDAETLYRKLSETADNKYGFLSQLRLRK